MNKCLKPCPFCNGQAIETDRHGCCSNNSWVEIQCLNCGAKIEDYPECRWFSCLKEGGFNMTLEQERANFEVSRQVLREKWNNRPISSELERLVKQCKKIAIQNVETLEIIA
jgi:hypothetical protein